MRLSGDDAVPWAGHLLNVTESSPDWHLKAWLRHFGKRQADLLELGWTNNRAHILYHSKQPYRREDINAVAAWLGIQPAELLMHPEEALFLKRLRETAASIANWKPPVDGTSTPVSPGEKVSDG